MEIRPLDKMDLRRQSVYRFLCIRFPSVFFHHHILHHINSFF